MRFLQALHEFALVLQVDAVLCYPGVEYVRQVVLAKVLAAQHPECLSEGVLLPEVPNGRNCVDTLAEHVDALHKLIVIDAQVL